MRIRNAFSPTSVGATGHTNNAMAATIVVSMTNASSASSATMAVAATTNTTTGRVPLSTKTRTSSLVASTASTPSTCTKSAVPTCATKRVRNCAQTTTSTGTKVVITTTIATRVATMSCTGARILPCPAMVMQVQATRAKHRRTFTQVRVKRHISRLGDVPSSSHSCKSGGTSKKRCKSEINLDWDKMFKDTFITDIKVADLENGIQVDNPFAFRN
jgi:hypothetical protein